MSRPLGGLGSNLSAHLAWQVSLLPPDPSPVPHSHLNGSWGHSTLSLELLCPWAGEWSPGCWRWDKGQEETEKREHRRAEDRYIHPADEGGLLRGKLRLPEERVLRAPQPTPKFPTSTHLPGLIG